MAFELEALVGNLYVAGGRTIKTTPPGALCEVAPRRAARGREIDTIFVLVLPSGTIAPNTFYEQMALMAAERYFSQSGSVTSAMRDVLNTLNHNLYNHNQSGRQHYEANMLLAVMRAQKLYVARVGAATMVLQQNDTRTTIPADLTDDDALFQPPLGVNPIPEIELNKYDIEKGTRLVLSDANLVEITEDNIDAAIADHTIEGVLDSFKERVTLQIQMMAIEFVPPEKSVMVPAATGQSTAVLSAELAAARSKAIADEAAEKARLAEAAAAAREANTPRRRLQRRIKQAIIVVSRSIGHFFMALGNLASKLFGREPTTQGKRARTTVITAAVFGLPAIILTIVLLSWVFNIGQTAFEECVAQAVRNADVARSIETGARNSLLAAWQGTKRSADECEQLRPDTNDPTLSEIQREAQDVLDRLNSISRRVTGVLYPIPDENANISSMILQGLDLYVLDSTNSLVYRIQLTEDGMGIASTPQPIPNMRLGARVEGRTVGRIVDIAFSTETSRSQIVALDENGLMITCLPTFINECDAQQLLGTENWANPTRIGFFGRNFYVMDTGTDQILRYETVGTTDNYGNAPQEYFASGLRYDLSNAVDFEIGTIEPIRGKIYILYADGTMTAFFGGEPEGFSFGSFPDGLALSETGAERMYLTNDPIGMSFFFISRATRTIYETSAGGAFARAYRVFDEGKFERLNAVAADSENEVVYAASGNTVLVFRKAE